MQKLPIYSFGFVIPALMICFCNAQHPAQQPKPTFAIVSDSLPYDLQNPTLTINLVSEALKEISGLSPSDVEGIYLAIADERGEVFFVDANRGGIVIDRVLFREKGDFEGIEMVDHIIWAAKSNGDLYQLSNWKEHLNMEEFKTPLKKENDVEGLAYDPWRKALLLACKEKPDSLYPRHIYAFDLKSKVLDEAPAYTINPEDVNRLVAYGETEKHDYFSPSGIAVHPFTGDLYVISTALKRLVVVDYKTGKVKFAQRLDKKILPQPEGISFDAKGNLLLSSEGKQGEGLLLKFDYRGKK